VLLGIVSMPTDISSESVKAVLPIYITTTLGMSALTYGFIDGIYQGVSALVRIAGGWVADRTDRPQWVARRPSHLGGQQSLPPPGNELRCHHRDPDRRPTRHGSANRARDALIAAASPPAAPSHP
jgi:hypothetical protein